MFKNTIIALNDVNTNVWGFLILLVGVALACCGKDTLGSPIVTGAFALINQSARVKTAQTETP